MRRNKPFRWKAGCLDAIHFWYQFRPKVMLHFRWHIWFWPNILSQFRPYFRFRPTVLFPLLSDLCSEQRYTNWSLKMGGAYQGTEDALEFWVPDRTAACQSRDLGNCNYRLSSKNLQTYQPAYESWSGILLVLRNCSKASNESFVPDPGQAKGIRNGKGKNLKKWRDRQWRGGRGRGQLPPPP